MQVSSSVKFWFLFSEVQLVLGNVLFVANSDDSSGVNASVASSKLRTLIFLAF